MICDNKKSIIKFLIIIIFLFSVSTKGVAKNYEQEAKVLEKLEIIDSASRYDELIKRVEVSAIISRLFETENDLEKINITFSFTDVPNWGKKYVNYLYRNEIINGKSETNFASTENMRPYEFVTVVLRMLGYSDKKGDFQWKNALEKALEIKLIDNNQYQELLSMTYISRNYVYAILTKALFSKINSLDIFLLESLYYNGNAITLDEIKSLDYTTSLLIYNKIKNNNYVVDKSIKTKDKKTIFDNNVSAITTLNMCSVESSNISQGTGFFIDKTGILITNYHVISGRQYGIGFLANKAPYYIMGVYDYNKSHDIAILKFEDNTYPSLTIGDSDKIFVGQKIYTIGSPKGNANTISEGWIVKKSVNVVKMDIPLIMASATIDSGASGSPVFDAYGNVIGIASSKIFYNDKHYAGIIPINFIKNMNTSDYKRLYNILDITNDKQ